MADVRSFGLHAGVHEFKTVMVVIKRIDESTPVDDDSVYDNRDYGLMVRHFEQHLRGVLDHPDARVREGYFRCVVDLMVNAIDGGFIGDFEEWDPVAATAAGFELPAGMPTGACHD